MNWQVCWTRQALKDAKKILRAGLDPQVDRLVDVLQVNPFQNPLPYEKLIGDMEGAYSRRINIHHRSVYQVIREKKAVKIIRLWTHYE